jgi:hypothetical protein
MLYIPYQAFAIGAWTGALMMRRRDATWCMDLPDTYSRVVGLLVGQYVLLALAAVYFGRATRSDSLAGIAGSLFAVMVVLLVAFGLSLALVVAIYRDASRVTRRGGWETSPGAWAVASLVTGVAGATLYVALREHRTADGTGLTGGARNVSDDAGTLVERTLTALMRTAGAVVERLSGFVASSDDGGTAADGSTADAGTRVYGSGNGEDP